MEHWGDGHPSGSFSYFLMRLSKGLFIQLFCLKKNPLQICASLKFFESHCLHAMDMLCAFQYYFNQLKILNVECGM